MLSVDLLSVPAVGPPRYTEVHLNMEHIITVIFEHAVLFCVGSSAYDDCPSSRSLAVKQRHDRQCRGPRSAVTTRYKEQGNNTTCCNAHPA